MSLIDASALAALGGIALIWVGAFLLGLLFAHLFRNKQ
jgi:hypothetical protein